MRLTGGVTERRLVSILIGLEVLAGRRRRRGDRRSTRPLPRAAALARASSAYSAATSSTSRPAAWAWLRAIAASPIRARIAGSSTRRPMRSANPASSSRSTSQPVTPSITTSSTPPTRVATTGRPVAPASIRTSGVPSLSDEFTTMSAAACHAGIASLQPANRTASASPSAAACASSSGRSGPSPTMHSRVSGDRACTLANTRSRRSIRLIVREPPGGDHDDVVRRRGRAPPGPPPGGGRRTAPARGRAGSRWTRSRRPILRSASSRRCSSLSTIVRLSSRGRPGARPRAPRPSSAG